MDQRHLPLTAPSVTPDALSPRQREVAALVSEGLTNAAISRRLAIPQSMVADHVEQALRALQQRSRAQLAVWTIRHGLVMAPASAVDGGTDGTTEVAL